MVNPLEFLTAVRAEANKVTWPTRRETLQTTVAVLVMVVAASLFFLAVDQSIRLFVTFVLSLARWLEREMGWRWIPPTGLEPPSGA